MLTRTTRSDLTDQWDRLCLGYESPADVSASLDAWRRECALLAHVTTLAEVPGLTRDRRTADQMLCYLVDRARGGDQIAHRTVLQAFLPALWRGHASPEVDAEVLGSAWIRIIEAPTDGSVKLATWLGMQIRHIHSERATRNCVPLYATWDQVDQGEQPGDSVEWSGLVDHLSDSDRQLLELLFLKGYTVTDASRELGISFAAVSKRRERALQRVATRLPRLLAA